jgi:hypothetical protein
LPKLGISKGTAGILLIRNFRTIPLVDGVDLRPVLRDHERIHGELLGFPVQGQLESVRQNALKHGLESGLYEIESGIAFRLRDDVVSFGIHPSGLAGDLKITNLIGPGD